MWTHAEQELSCELAPGVVLMGRIDARGVDTTGRRFFADWKTANPRKKTTWKATWRMNPQSLTYGVLLRHTDAEACSRFTVRQAFKTSPPTFDYAWYSYTEPELDVWERELLRIASEIRAYRAGSAPWPLDFNACFAWGPQYACPFFEQGCAKQQWSLVPRDVVTRISHLDAERRLYAANLDPMPIVLDATRVARWLECRERFRREYIDNIVGPPGEALVLGIAFHEELAKHYESLIKR